MPDTPNPDRSAGDPSCPMCGSTPDSPPGCTTMVGAAIGSALVLVVTALVLYWPMRWIVDLYVGIFS